MSILLATDGPVEYRLASTLDGLYTPYALQRPARPGPHPFVFLAYGNGGGGLDWLRDRVAHFPYITDRLLDAGYACAWGRYRSEVELGYHHGGALVRDRRQGMDLFNRSPLEFEDELAILDDVRTVRGIDPRWIGHVGVSHAGEMLFKLAGAFPDAVTAGVACEPANHEFLDLNTDATVTVNEATGLRDIEEMQMHDAGYVRARINEALVAERIKPIRTPMLVMGRDQDHLQGVFRVSYDVLAEAGKDVRWVSFDHPLHGYVFPVDDAVDSTQERAVDGIVQFLDEELASRPAGGTTEKPTTS